MNHSLKLKKPLAVFDLETTGTNISRDRIVEISIAKAMPDGSVEVKTKRINPEMPIPIESSLIHGIYDEDVKDEPTFRQMAKSMAQFLQGCDLAGFNSNRFDIPMLVEEFLRVDSSLFDVKNRKFVDVQRIFHQMEPRTLSAAYKFYCDKTLDNAHSAEADTLATLEVLDAQIARYEGVKIETKKGEEIEPIKNDVEVLHEFTSSKIVDFAARMAYNDKDEIVFNFGKHKGKLVTDVLKREPAYFDWIMNNDFPRDTKQKLTQIKLSTSNTLFG
ncbi:3'-5' exonuclease [Jiulongibacter sediminis]|uniref:DNA polymerase III subunit epsilon n=1 Tax=Jiulongibacter sediminis TaxID=1605367 RepID=A0A0P7C040_9BACT|nr:3'-5' exonuclease [Jiulongibacter sediminis]KPM46690.1 DNA polymerase III subunit epsilon [Jiulongibacter sediminis]TBX21595.1 DNA polymerase III subunit epsilon [Jiulongibacter sediminis]